MPFAAAAVGAAAISAGASIYASEQQKGQSKKALAAATAAQEQARDDVAPWRETGVQANAMLGDLSGLNGAEARTNAMLTGFQADPSYAYTFSEAQRAADTSAAAKGLLRSGATLRAQEELGANLASQGFGTYLNRLTGLSQQGLSAAGNQAQTANNQASTQTTFGTQMNQITGNENAAVQQGIKNALVAYGSQGNPQPNSMYGNVGAGVTGNGVTAGNAYSPAATASTDYGVRAMGTY